MDEDDDAVRLMATVAPGVRVLTTLYLLDRSTDAHRPPIECGHIDPRSLLAATYNLIIQTPARLTRHLDLCARLAATTTVCHLAVPPDRNPAAIACRIDEHQAVLSNHPSGS